MDEKVSIETNEREKIKNWYRLYYPMVRKLVMGNGGSKEDAEDVFQESIIVLLEKTRDKTFKLTSKESTYVHSIAQNKLMDLIRKKKRNFSTANIIDLNDIEVIDDELYDFEM
jgi:RNA polymerase sigma factor (sigma-70 family)